MNKMMPTKIYIVEDDAFTRASLVSSLEQEGYVVVGSSAVAEKALNEIVELKPAIAILDVYLGSGPDGVWIASQLEELGQEVHVIYLTAYSDHETVERIKGTRPKCYLKKPYDLIALTVSIDLLVLNDEKQREGAQMESEYMVTFHNGIKTFLLDYRNIHHVVSDGNYVRITTSDGSYFIRGNLKDILELLAGRSFVQIHRSVIVNRIFITDWNSTSALVAGTRFNIGRSYRKALGEK